MLESYIPTMSADLISQHRVSKFHRVSKLLRVGAEDKLHLMLNLEIGFKLKQVLNDQLL